LNVLTNITFGIDEDKLLTVTKSKRELHGRSGGNYVSSPIDVVTEEEVQLEAVSPPFTPPAPTELKLWLKPEGLVGFLNNDKVTLWPDSSGNGKDFQPVVGGQGALYKTNQINSLPAVSFDGTSNSQMACVSATPIPGVAFAMFVVLKFNSGTGREWVYKNGEGTGYSLAKWDDNRIVFNNSGVFVTDDTCVATVELWSVVRTTGPDLVRMWVNETEQTITNASDPFSAAGAGEGQKLGAYLLNTYLLDGLIAEVMVWDTALSELEIEQVQTYLLAKYSL
jgi:hypothetical protein